MTSLAIKRIAWKEFRQQLAFFLALLALASGLQVMINVLLSPALSVASSSYNIVFSVVGGFAALFAVAIGATLYATEKESGTVQFLQLLPINSRMLLVGKLLPSLGFCLAFLLVASAIGAVAANLGNVSPGYAGAKSISALFLFAFFGLIAVEFFVWGWFFSLITNRPLVSAILGIVTASLVIQVTVRLLNGPVYDAFALEPYWIAAAPRLGMALLLFGLNLAIAGRWLERSSSTATIREQLGMGEVSARSSPLQRTSARSITFRFMWHTVRASWPMMLIYVLILVGSIGLAFVIQPLAFMAPVLALLAASTAGAMVFLPDHTRNAYRFLSHVGERPSLLWWGRVIPWCALIVVVNLVLLAIGFIVMTTIEPQTRFAWPAVLGGTANGIGISSGFGVVAMLAFQWTATTLIVFFAGLFASSVVRSSVIAGIVAGLLGGLGAVWCLLMFFSGSPWWTIVGAAAIFVVSSWLAMGPWLAQASWRRHVVPALGLVVVGSATLLFAFANHRVNEIPATTIQFQQGPQPDRAVIDEMRTRFSQAAASIERPQKLVSAISGVFGIVLQNEGQPDPVTFEPHIADDYDHAWWAFGYAMDQANSNRQEQTQLGREFVADNQASLQQLQDAIDYIYENREQLRLMAPSYYGITLDPRQPAPPFELRQSGTYELLEMSFELHVHEADFDQAWSVLQSYYKFRSCHHLVYPNDSNDWRPAVFGWINHWSNSKLADIELLTKGIAFLEKDELFDIDYSRHVQANYLERLQQIRTANFVRGSQSRKPSTIEQFASLVLRSLPWERQRAERLVTLMAHAELDETENWEYMLEHLFRRPASEVSWWEEIGLVREDIDFHRWFHSTVFPRDQSDTWFLTIRAYPTDYWDSFRNQSTRMQINLRNMTPKRQMLILKLAIRAWEAKYGGLPKSLDQLVGEFVDELPTEKVIGRKSGANRIMTKSVKFHYFPEGFRVPLADHVRGVPNEYRLVIPANTPFISTLPIDQYNWATRIDVEDWKPTEPVQDPAPRVLLNEDYWTINELGILVHLIE